MSVIFQDIDGKIKMRITTEGGDELSGYIFTDTDGLTKVRVHMDGGGGSVTWDDVSGKPAAFPPSAHNQAFTTITGVATAAQIPTLPQSKVTNLTTDLAAKIEKSVVAELTFIVDPAIATAEDVATAYNALLAALKS